MEETINSVFQRNTSDKIINSAVSLSAEEGKCLKKPNCDFRLFRFLISVHEFENPKLYNEKFSQREQRY